MASTSTSSSHISSAQRHDRIAQPDRPTQDPETSVAQKMLSAVSGSVLTSLLVTPLDVVRVRLQAQPRPSPTSSSSALPSFLGPLPPNLGVTACCREVFWVQNQSQFCVASPHSSSSTFLESSSTAQQQQQHTAVSSDCAAEETRRRTFNSTLDGLRKIARNEGIWTLWRGLSPTLMMAVPGNVIYFAGYDWLRTSKLSPIEGRVSDTYAPLAAGSLARVLAAIAVSPIEMLRTRMQAHQSVEERNVMRATIVGLREMVGTEGYTSLWRGLTLTFWRDVPFSALYWWGYEFGRARLREQRRRRGGSKSGREMGTKELLTDSFVAGASSGAIAALVTTPFDVGKTRQQTVVNSNMSADQRRALPESRTMPRFLWHIYRHDGMSGLFKGWAARCLKVAPACAIMISSYEIGKKMAVKVNEKED